MKKNFKKYAKYLRENHLEELVKKNLEISKTMDIPLMRLFTHLSDEQLLEMGKPSMEGILLSIEDDTFWEKAEATYKQWKEDKLKDISKHDIHPSDIVLINATRKKGFMSFIPSYSYEIDVISELMNEMDDFFRECDRTGMEVIYFIQKETENKYKESEERYRDLFESAKDLIHIADIDGNILFANNSWLNTTGYSVEDIPNLNIQKVIHPEYLNVFLERRKQVIEGNPPEEFYLAVISSSGKKTYLEGSISCHYVDGKAISTRGIFTNITERKINEEKIKIYTNNLVESEKKYRLLVENIKDYAIYMISPEGQIMSWNKGAEELQGYTSEEIMGKHISVFYPLNLVKDDSPEYLLAQAKELGKFQTENLRVRKDGSKFWANVLLTAMYDNDGNLKGFVKITRNITERKEAEEKIKTSEAKLKAIFDHAPDAIIVTDLDRKITSWNKAAEKMYGYTLEEVLGKNGIDLLPTELSAPYTKELASKEIEEKGTWEGEATTITKNGEKIVVIASATTLYDQKGNPTGMLAVNKDISERKKADEKIAKTVQLLNEAEQVAHFGSWEINIKTNEITWSDELYRIYGIDPSETESLWKEFFRYINPDDKDLVVRLAEKAIQDKQPVLVDYRITNAKGELRTLKANCSIISNVNETEFKLTGTVQDITEQKAKDDKITKTLQQLKEAQQMAHIGSWEWDVVSNIIGWSDELYRIFGLLPNEFAASYEGYLKHIHPDDVELVNNTITKALENKQPFKFEHKLIRKDGSIRIVNSTGVVSSNNEGHVVKMFGTAQDITERVLNKEELKKAEETVKAKQQFLSNMSHEIRTPLNSIIGFTKVVLKSNLNSKQREYLDAIKLSGQTLLVLINDILDLAKVDAGQMIFEKIPFKLSSSVSAMLHLFDTKVQEKNIKLLNEYDHRIPEVLLGDPVRLHQIILNLVSNAIKFTEQGTIVMKTLLIEELSNSVKIEFSITDTGIGIHEDKLDTIFENFQQGSSSTGRLFGGTGLGLAIVKNLVTHQGGTIEVKSKVKQGTTFTFWLTFEKAGTNQFIETEEEINDDLLLKKIKILVVEDVVLNQLLMKAILDDFGYEYDIEENGRTAVEKLKTDKYDIVLMDLQMPEMNGFEATEYIRQNLPYPVCNVPIIALTADVTTIDLEKCIAAGMNDYATKPVDEKQLLSKINKLLKQPFKVEEELVEMKEDRSNIKEKCINLEYLKNKVKGNSELMKQMIEVYLEQTPNLIKKMRESLENKDWETLHKAAHRIIPSFVMVGIDPEFEAMAKKIFEFAILQEQYDEIHEMFLKIEEVCMQACRELETEYLMFKKDDNN